MATTYTLTKMEGNHHSNGLISLVATLILGVMNRLTDPEVLKIISGWGAVVGAIFAIVYYWYAIKEKILSIREKKKALKSVKK